MSNIRLDFNGNGNINTSPNESLSLPRKIFLQGWAGDQGNNDINGEYTFIGNHSSVPSRQNIYINESISTPGEGVDDHPAIYWNGSYWEHDSNDIGWRNNSTNPNELPLTGWIINDAWGPAGTIISTGSLKLNRYYFWHSYGRSFNGYKFIYSPNEGWLYNYITYHFPAAASYWEEEIFIYIQLRIVYFKVGDRVIVNAISPPPYGPIVGTLFIPLGSVPYQNQGYGWGTTMLTDILNSNSILNKYLTFYPAADNRHVVKVKNDETITLVLRDYVEYYDQFQDVTLFEYVNCPQNYAFWTLSFNNEQGWATKTNNSVFGTDATHNLGYAPANHVNLSDYKFVRPAYESIQNDIADPLSSSPRAYYLLK